MKKEDLTMIVGEDDRQLGFDNDGIYFIEGEKIICLMDAMDQYVTFPKTIQMPYEEYEQALINAFESGCQHGYAVEHTSSLIEQERLGALHYVGQISDDEFYACWNELRKGC